MYLNVISLQGVLVVMSDLDWVNVLVNITTIFKESKLHLYFKVDGEQVPS